MEQLSNEYKETTSFEKRCNTSCKLLEQHKTKIPIIIILSPKIRVNGRVIRYLISKNLEIVYVSQLVRNTLKLNPSEGIFILTDNGTLLSNQTVGEIYLNHKDIDGYLYVNVYKENVFGI